MTVGRMRSQCSGVYGVMVLVLGIVVSSVVFSCGSPFEGMAVAAVSGARACANIRGCGWPQWPQFWHVLMPDLR